VSASLHNIGFHTSSNNSEDQTPEAEQAAEKVPRFVILSEAKNLSWI